MAYARQGVTVVKKKGGNIEIKSGSSLFIAVKKTGYYNFSIAGKTYYFDEKMDANTISNEVLIIAFNGGNKKYQEKKKGKIVVTKK